MATMQISNINSVIGTQNNASNGDIHIHNYPKKRDKNEIVKFDVPRLVESFRGRSTELEQLTTWFFQNEKPMVAICGLPGYGKTELAKHFTRDCLDKKLLQNILWINSERRESMEHSFRELLKWLDDRSRSDLDINSVVQKVHQHFNTKSSMFVFDNARDRQNIVDFEPTGKSLSLITSHLKDWGDNIPSLELSPLEMNAALDVLRVVLQHRFQDENEGLYRELADTCSCVPLALQVVAAYVRQEMCELGHRFDLSKCVRKLNNSRQQFIETSISNCSENTSENTYKNSISHAIKLSLQKIIDSKFDKKKSVLALKILHVCAYLNPDKIIISDLLNKSCIQNLLLNSDDACDDLTRAVSLLDKYSFVHFVENQVIIHRLVQDTLIQIQLEENDQQDCYFACLEHLLLNIDNFHSYFILKYADKHLVTFQNFYFIHKSDISSKNIFFYNLIATGCKTFLSVIFNDLGCRSADIINSHVMLHESVKCRQYSVLELLLEHGANVDERHDSGDTVLHLAAKMLDLRAIKLLTSNNADLNATDTAGDSVLHLVVAASGRPQFVARPEEACEILRWLKQCGANTDVVTFRGWTLLHKAALAHSADLIHFLVSEFHMNVHAVDIVGRTPLYRVCDVWSAERGRRLRTAIHLVEHGARLEVADKWNYSPEKYARKWGLEYIATYLQNPLQGYVTCKTLQASDVIRGLVATGDITSLTQKLNELGDSAAEKINEYYLLHEAAHYGQHDMLELLLERGADINSTGDGNATALHVAARELELETVQVLVTRGADVNAVDVGTWTVLHALILSSGLPRHAGREDELCEMLRWLAQRGARTDALTSGDSSLLHTAAWALHTNLIHFLIREFHLSVHDVTTYSRTPLFLVNDGLDVRKLEEKRGITAARCLLEHGARIDVVDVYGRTPAQDARTRGFENLAKLLENPENFQEPGIESSSETETDACTWWQSLRDMYSRATHMLWRRPTS